MSTSVGRRPLTFVAVTAMLFSLLAVSAPIVGATSIGTSPILAAAAVIDTCGYSDATFNENTIMRSAAVYGTGLNATIGAFANDEKALLLGVNGATANTASPQHVSNPALGDQSLKDPSGRTFFPSLYITNVTANAGSTAGDWQSGGTPVDHVDDVFGTWTTATIAGGNFTDTLPPAKNNWNLGAGADTPPAGTTAFNEGYGSEVRWDANNLGLQPGNTYRLQMIVHDGDQNKSGGDAGEFCVTLSIPGTPLSAKKVVDKTTALPGDTLTYTITVQNSNPTDATGVDITDDISAVVPGHGALTRSNPNATVTGGNQLSWPNQTIAANSTATYKYFVKLADTGWAAGTTNLPNVVVVTKTNCVAGSNDPNCKTTTTVTPQPHIKVVKTPDAQTVVAGSSVGFTITVTSDGDNTATSVSLSDALPTLANAGINWVISPVYGGPGTCSIAGFPPAETLNCNFADLAKGATASVHVQSPTTAPAGGAALGPCAITTETFATNLDNSVTVTSTNATSATAHAGTCVTGQPHVTVTKTPDNQTVVAGNPVGFTITVKSDGIGTANGVTLSDPLPTTANVSINWSISPAYAGQGTCGINGAPPAETLNCNFLNIASGTTLTVHVTSATTAPAGGNVIAACQVGVVNYATNLDNTVTITSQNAGSATAVTGICVTGNPHVTVTKTPDNQSVVAGSPVGFTITVKSDGIGTANGVTLSDPLPTTPNVGISWAISPAYAGQGTCGINGAAPAQTLNCNFVNIPSGTTLTVHVASSTTAPVGGNTVAACQIGVVNYATNLDNTVTITSSNAGGGTAVTGICVTGNPHLKVTKTPDAQSVVAGSNVGFTMTVTSDGIGAANNVTLNDPLPTLANAGINWFINPVYTDQGSCSITGAAPAQTLSCTIGTLASGSSISVHVTSATTAPAAGVAIAACAITVTNFATNLDNAVTVTSSNASSATAQTGTCVLRPPHVKVTKTPDAQTVVAGNAVGFTMTVTNDGFGKAINVALSDALPTLANTGVNWSISPAYAGPGTCAITGAAPAQTLNCSFGDLGQGASASVHVTSPTTAPAPGVAIAACAITVTTYATNLDNTVNVTSQQAGSATAQTGICVTGTPHISVTKTADNQIVQAGNQLGFTITVKSDGVGTVTGVTVNDTLPTLTGFGINWSINPLFGGPGTCSIVPVAIGNSTQALSCNLGDLGSGTSVAIHLISPSTAPAPGIAVTPCAITVTTYATNLNNQVNVTSQNAGSAIAQTGICIPPTPHLVVTKTADAQTVVAGNQIGFTITVKNDGTGTATGVTVNDPLPTLAGIGVNWSISPAFGGPGTCSINGAAPTQTLSCAIGDLPQGASASVHVTSPTTAPAGGVVISACAITVTTYATNLNNQVNVTSQNAGSATAQTGTCVTSTPHITVTKTPDAQTVLAGNAVGFTITVKSDGNGTATAVALTDALPTLANAGINWAISPAFAGPGTCSITGAVPSQTLTCAFGDMAAGTQATVHVTSATTAPAGNTTLAPCVITVTTFATNLNNAVQVTSQSAAGATAQTGTCVTKNPNPAIHIVKVANPTVLPVGGGTVVYSYTVTNSGNVPLSNITVNDDKCPNAVFLNGDTNGDAKLDTTETWKYSCTAKITVTTTNTVVARGEYDDPALGLRKVSDQDQATVVVPVPTPTPTGSVGGATSPPKPHVTLPPTDGSTPLGTGGDSGILMILILLAGIAAAVPVLVFGKRRQVRR